MSDSDRIAALGNLQIAVTAFERQLGALDEVPSAGLEEMKGAVDDVRMRITSTDHDGIPTSAEVPDFKLFEDRESTHDFRVPPRTASLHIALTAKVKSLSTGKTIDLATGQSFPLNGIDRSDKTEDLHFAKFGAEYVIELLGRTGEAKADRPVQLAIKHRDFREQVNVTLKTDAKGRLNLGRLTDITSLTDRGTAFIFADGAGAAVVGPSDEPGIAPVVWGSDGEQFDLIRQKEDWRDVMASEKPEMPHLIMAGNPVFRWASYEMAKVAHQALDKAGITAEQLDVFVPHQANMRIIDAMARSMKLPERVKIARDIAHQGNTSAASIPLALDGMIDAGEAKSGDTALLIAFGAGLAYAAQVVKVP